VERCEKAHWHEFAVAGPSPAVWHPPTVSAGAEPVTLRSLGPSVYLPSVLFFVGDGSLIAIVALAARDLGASPALAGFVVALRGLGVLAFDIPAGWTLSRFGERATIVAASATVVLTLVGWLLTTSVLVFAVLAFVQGCGWAAWALARLAFVSEVVPPTLRGRAMSLLGGTNRVGMFVGPFLAALASHVAGFDGVFVVAIVLVAVAAVAFLHAVPPGRDVEHKGVAVPVADVVREHAGVFLTAGLAAMSLQALRQARNALLPLWADGIGLSVQTTSVLFGLSLGVELLLVYPGGSVMDRWGRKAVAIPCLVIMSVGLALMPLTDGAGTLALVAMLLGAGNGLSSGVVMTLGADFAPPAARVPFLGVWRVLSDLGTAGGPLVVAAATAAITLGGAAVTVGALGLLAAAFVLRFVPETGVTGS
jgi:MFS family permease